MYKILVVFLISFWINPEVFAQVSFGKRAIDGSGLIDFAQDSGKGIILPIVESLPLNADNGTILTLKSDSSIYIKEDGNWTILSKNGKLPLSFFITSSSENDSTVVGSRNSSASGVLVLESNNKALILPKNLSNHNDIKSPRIGTLAYDKTYKSISVFDGIKWVYWR